MKKTIKFSLLFVLATFIAFVNPLKAQDANKEMNAFVKKFENSYNKKDAMAIKAMFTDDAVRTNTDGSVVTGSEAIGAEFTDQFKDNDFKLVITQEKAEMQPDGSIMASGTYRVTGKSGAGEDVDFSGKYEGTNVKVDGKWKIAKQVLTAM
ncbi:MAG: nuclear transport factor 2 family protein [Ferruginibacter sp.]